MNTAEIAPILRANIDCEARLMTDEAGYYVPLGKDFASHDSVNHQKGEYGRGEIHTNTEGSDKGKGAITRLALVGNFVSCKRRSRCGKSVCR